MQRGSLGLVWNKIQESLPSNWGSWYILFNPFLLELIFNLLKPISYILMAVLGSGHYLWVGGDR